MSAVPQIQQPTVTAPRVVDAKPPVPPPPQAADVDTIGRPALEAGVANPNSPPPLAGGVAIGPDMAIRQPVTADPKPWTPGGSPLNQTAGTAGADKPEPKLTAAAQAGVSNTPARDKIKATYVDPKTGQWRDPALGVDRGIATPTSDAARAVYDSQLSANELQ